MPFTTDGFRGIEAESYLAESNLGVALRQARLKRKLSLDDVAAVLHIRKEYLQAIEQGSYRQLPGRTYAIGFVRAYASHLDLDPLDAIQRFKDETVEGAPDADLTFPRGRYRKASPGCRHRRRFDSCGRHPVRRVVPVFLRGHRCAGRDREHRNRPRQAGQTPPPRPRRPLRNRRRR